MSREPARTFSYPLMGWPIPALLIAGPALGGTYAIVMFTRDHATELLILGAVALLCGTASYFYYPVSVTIAGPSIEVRYLFGPTLWFGRKDVTHTATVTGNVAKLRVRDERRLSRLIGVFLLALPWVRGSDDLLRALGE